LEFNWRFTLLPDPERDSIQKMQVAIRETRNRMGLPEEGTLRQEQLLEALRKKPPIQKIVGYVKKSLEDDPPLSERLKGFKPPPPRFDKSA
jgi:actin-like ATPase involved in cell morphogenesis